MHTEIQTEQITKQRLCIRCGTMHPKLVSNGKGKMIEKWYHYQKRTKDGKWLCYICWKKIKRATTVYYRNVKNKVFTHYFGSDFCCDDCGETDIMVLQLDHVNGGGNKQRIEIFGNPNTGGGKFYAWLIAQGYPDFGLRPRCANCHIKIECKRIEDKRIKS